MRTKKDNKIEYTPLNLPKALVEELKVWKTAFERSNPGAVYTYERIIRGMLDSLDVTEPDVVAELDRMMEANPSLINQMANYTYLDAAGKRRYVDWEKIDGTLDGLLEFVSDEKKVSELSRVRPWAGGEVIVLDQEDPSAGYDSDIIIVTPHCNIISWAFYIIRDNCQSVVNLYPYREMYFRRIGQAALDAVKADKTVPEIIRSMVTMARMLP